MSSYLKSEMDQLSSRDKRNKYSERN